MKVRRGLRTKNQPTSVFIVDDPIKQVLYIMCVRRHKCNIHDIRKMIAPYTM